MRALIQADLSRLRPQHKALSSGTGTEAPEKMSHLAVLKRSFLANERGTVDNEGELKAHSVSSTVASTAMLAKQTHLSPRPLMGLFSVKDPASGL